MIKKTLLALLLIAEAYGLQLFAMPVHPPTLYLPAPFDETVGSTKDGCDGEHPVKFEGKDGTVTIHRNNSGTVVELPSSTRELNWYCGGSRERSANDKPFNAVKISRASNGAIQWVFLVKSAPPAPAGPGSGGSGSQGGGTIAGGQVRVGETKDACDRSHTVSFHASQGTVNVKAGEMKVADLNSMTREIRWTCGDSSERSATDNPFNRVQIERAGNGAIQWIFYRTTAASINPVTAGGATKAPTAGFLHNVRGDVLLAARAGGSDISVPPLASGALKSALDSIWNARRADTTNSVTQTIPTGAIAGVPGKLRVDSIELSSSSQGELRVAESSDKVTLKYVVHENQVKVTDVLKDPGPDSKLKIVFDIELVVVALREQSLSNLRAEQAGAFVRHVDIEGGNFIGSVVIGLLKSKIRATETRLGNIHLDVIAAVNQELEKARQGIQKKVPSVPISIGLDIDQAGDLRVCGKAAGATSCNFPAASASLPSPHVLDTSNDKCSQGKIWLWDSELSAFVSVSRGQSGKVVEVDNQRFEWYCGDDNAPDPSSSNRESASGPKGTYAVRVARDADGPAIHWQFLSWH